MVALMLWQQPEQPRQSYLKCLIIAVFIQFSFIARFQFATSMLSKLITFAVDESSVATPRDGGNKPAAAFQYLTEQQGSPSYKWAYAFLVAGCDSLTRGHVGYLYNVLVASYILKYSASQADVVVMVRMSSATNESALPLEEVAWLKACGVKIKYLPKMTTEQADSFYTAMMDKFRILDLVEYSRVIFMDSDAIPLCNMDYVFEMSDSRKELEENLVIAWKFEPSQGGFFMLRPGPGEFIELERLIHKREEKSKTLPWPHFDEMEGWGHKIQSPDHWVNFYGKTGTQWDWYGVFADQGLLYMWTKYVKKRVSIVINDSVQNWDHEEGKQDVYMKVQTTDLFGFSSCSTHDPYSRGRLFESAPYRDFHHFTGRKKPWISSKLKQLPFGSNNMTHATNPTQLWFHALHEVIKKHDMNINITHLDAGKSPLGLFPTWYQMAQKLTAEDDELNVTRTNNKI